MTKIFTHKDLILAHYKELDISKEELNLLVNNDEELIALKQTLELVSQHVNNTAEPSDHVLAAIAQAAKISQQTPA